MAGAMSLYGHAEGDPVSFADALGLCPPRRAAFEVASLFGDVGDLAVTGMKYARGRASGSQFAFTKEQVRLADGLATTSGALRASVPNLLVNHS